MPDIVKLLLFSLASVITLFVLSKLLGKKQIAQLDFVDYVLGISIGSIAAEMATDTGETPFYYYLIAMAIFFIFDFLITYLGRKGPFLTKFFKGKPTTIIQDGKINYKNLNKSKLDVNDLLLLCRQKDYFDIQDIAFAVFEPNGTLSILPVGNQKPAVVQDLVNIDIEKASLPTYLIIDGKVLKAKLEEIGKDEKWLFEKLNIKNKKELKKIILVSYDQMKEKLITHCKN